MQENLKSNYCLQDEQEENNKLCEEYNFSKFLADEDFSLDDELTGKLIPIARKLNLSQESLDLLLELALEMSKKQKEIYKIDEKTMQEKNTTKYTELFKQDRNIPSSNSLQLKEYMQTANNAYSQFASPNLKELLKSTGLIYHPEMIKMFFKIGELTKEDSLSYKGTPAVKELTPAQILYGPRD